MSARSEFATAARRLFRFLAAAGLVFATGCGDRGEPRVYRAPKDSPPAHRDEPTPPGPSSEAPSWTVPSAWKQLPEQPMRFATFQVDPADAKLVVAVYAFGPESGELLANVVRWEQQIGAPVSTEADVAKVVTKVKSNGLGIDRVDIHGPPESGQRMLAAILRVPGKVWFLKLVGADAGVAAHEAEFDAFLRSFAFENGAAPPAAGGSFTMKSYRTPDGWTLDPEPKQMRVATFHVRAGGDEAEVIVSSLPGEQSGSPEANFNRWRTQVGLGPVKDPGAVQGESVAVGDGKGTLLSFGGSAEPSPSGKQILVVQAFKGGSVWYFKLIGPASLVAAQRTSLVAFVASIEFTSAGK